MHRSASLCIVLYRCVSLWSNFTDCIAHIKIALFNATLNYRLHLFFPRLGRCFRSIFFLHLNCSSEHILTKQYWEPPRPKKQYWEPPGAKVGISWHISWISGFPSWCRERESFHCNYKLCYMPDLVSQFCPPSLSLSLYMPECQQIPLTFDKNAPVHSGQMQVWPKYEKAV